MSATSSVPPAPRGRHLSAKAAILVVLLATVVVLAFEGGSIRHTGEEMQPGWERTLVLSVGRPAGWVSDQLGLGDVKDALTGWARTGDELSGGGQGSFETQGPAAASAQGTAVPPVTVDSFDPAAVGDKPTKPAPLRTVLVTGDSMSMPLDAELARRIARSRSSVKTVRDPRVGTSLSQSEIVDWGKLSLSQVKRDRPNAVVVFIGANEGFPMRSGGREVKCCGRAWSVEYASRARRMMNTYRADGASRVYWMLLPAPRDRDRQAISRSVNAAIAVAAQPYRSQVRVVDLAALFTPGGVYRAAMPVDGRDELVREPDGVHLNGQGARLAADPVIAAMRTDYGADLPE